MGVFKFIGQVTGEKISGTVIGAASASAVSVGSILAFLVPIWIIALIANLFAEEGSFLFVLFAPLLLILVLFYGIFWLIFALLGALIGW